jgi:opacity protein-like surface antigen
MFVETGKRAKLVSILLASLISQSVYAATTATPAASSATTTTVHSNHSYLPDWHNYTVKTPVWVKNLKPLFAHYVISLSGFQGWESTNAKQTIFVTPDIVKSYVTNPSTQAFGTGELFVGVYQPINSMFEWQLGLALATNGNVRITGYIWDDGDARFSNYSYTYLVRSTHVDVKGKLLVDIGMKLIPWISANLGVAFNQAHEFNSSPSIYQAIPTPNFSSDTKVSATYTFGVGAQLPISENWQIGAGYEFSNWGKSQLGKATGQSTGNGPVLNQLYSSSVLLNLSYLA